MQESDMIVNNTISITALNPNTLSDDISHNNPVNIENKTEWKVFSYMDTATASGTISTGFIENISNKPGVV